MKCWLMVACLFTMMLKSQQLSIGRGTYKKLYGSKNQKKKLNVVYEMCMKSTPAYINAAARPEDSSLPHTFKVTVVDIKRYSVLVELERTDQKSGWNEIWLTVDWVASTPLRNCKEYFDKGYTNNATYEIVLSNGRALNVSCYMDPTSGGWTVVQRRKNGFVDFYQNWANYTNGFGNLDGDFWLGLENMHLLTSDNKSALRLDIGINCYNDQDYMFAQNVQYSFFHVASAAEAYKLNIGEYKTSPLGDSLTQSNGYSFSTYDNISDQIRKLNCSEANHAGWWRHGCFYGSINAVYAPCSCCNWETAGWNRYGGAYGAYYMAMMIQPREFKLT